MKRSQITVPSAALHLECRKFKDLQGNYGFAAFIFVQFYHCADKNLMLESQQSIQSSIFLLGVSLSYIQIISKNLCF